MVIRNNLVLDAKTMVSMNGVDPRPTKNVRIEGNVRRNTYDWAGSNNSDGVCLNMNGCQGFDSTIQDVRFANNFCSLSEPINSMIYINCNQDVGENPGSWIFSGNTFVAEDVMKWGILYQDDIDTGVFSEDDIHFQNNVLIALAGEHVLRMSFAPARLRSDYNALSAGLRYRWNTMIPAPTSPPGRPPPRAT